MGVKISLREHLQTEQRVKGEDTFFLILLIEMARPGRFELPTLCLEGRRSIQLSYGRISCIDSKSFIGRDDTILVPSSLC